MNDLCITKVISLILKTITNHISMILNSKKFGLNKINQSHFVFFFCLIFIITATVYIGAVPTRTYGHDIFFLLDNGWRIFNGQYPHVDFTSAWGPVTFLIVGLGMALSDGSVDAVGYGSAVFGSMIGLWSYYLCGNRVPPIIRVALSIYLVCLVVAPFPLGVEFQGSSHAMIYNRYGYALLDLIIIDILVLDNSLNNRTDITKAGISSGIAIAISFFLKISFFGGAVILAGVSLFYKNFSRAYLFGVISGFTAATIVFLPFIQFDIIDLFGDLKMAAGARANSVYYDEIKIRITENILLFLFVFLLIILFIISPNNIRNSDKQQNIKIICLGLAILFVDAIMLISNHQPFELPLGVFFTLLLLNREIQSRNDLTPIQKTSLTKRYYLPLLVPGIIFFLYFLGKNISGLGYGVLQKYRVSSFDKVEKFIEPRLASLILFDHPLEPSSNGHIYVQYVNDGIDLIRKNSRPHETVLTMDMFNPFSFAMGRPPAKGGIAASAFNYTISDQHHPSDSKFLGSADIFMVPKKPASPSFFYDGFYNIYQSSLKKNFNLIAESDLWFLYHRK